MAAIKVRLNSGLAGVPANQRVIVRGLGLKKFNSEKVLPDTAAVMGMIHKVSYLITWEKVKDAPPVGRRSRKSAKKAPAKQARA
jgi:large subunit ribosomal protein L30